MLYQEGSLLISRVGGFHSSTRYGDATVAAGLDGNGTHGRREYARRVAVEFLRVEQCACSKTSPGRHATSSDEEGDMALYVFILARDGSPLVFSGRSKSI